MEAIEYHYAECAPRDTRTASWNELAAAAERAVYPPRLSGFRSEAYFSNDFLIPWIRGEELRSQQSIWLPTSSIFAMEPTLYRWGTNGLASGNNLVEATLHAAFEVAERHVLSLLVRDGVVDFSGCAIVDCQSIDDAIVGDLVQRAAAHVRVQLLRVDVDWPIHTFLAVLLDGQPSSKAAAVNFGFGAHLAPSVAAARAISEAAQARATFIHGARENLSRAAYHQNHSRVEELFDKLHPDTSWGALRDHSQAYLEDDLQLTLDCLDAIGFDEIHRALLTPADAPIAVVKVMVCGALNSFPA
jgi:ribosomal protein S12 methylthiotransferase accessory factor